MTEQPQRIEPDQARLIERLNEGGDGDVVKNAPMPPGFRPLPRDGDEDGGAEA